MIALPSRSRNEQSNDTGPEKHSSCSPVSSFLSKKPPSLYAPHCVSMKVAVPLRRIPLSRVIWQHWLIHTLAELVQSYTKRARNMVHRLSAILQNWRLWARVHNFKDVVSLSTPVSSSITGLQLCRPQMGPRDASVYHIALNHLLCESTPQTLIADRNHHGV